MNTEAHRAEMAERAILVEEERRRKALGVSVSPRLEEKPSKQNPGATANMFATETDVQTSFDQGSDEDEDHHFYPTRTDFKF